MKEKIINLVFKLLTVFFCFGMFLNLIRTLEENKVLKNGEKVEVIIKKIPDICHQNTKVRKDFEFEYNHKLYSKRVGYGVCDKKVNEKFTLIHWQEKENIFLFPEEDIVSSIYNFIFLFILGLAGLIISFWVNIYTLK